MLIELLLASGEILQREMAQQGTISDLKKEIARSRNVSRSSPVILMRHAILDDDVLICEYGCAEPLPDWCIIDDIITAELIMPYACSRFTLVFSSLMCASCGAAAHKMMRCAGKLGRRCVARYCNEVCQIADWHAHKPSCGM